jgi:hypothetical protein
MLDGLSSWLITPAILILVLIPHAIPTSWIFDFERVSYVPGSSKIQQTRRVAIPSLRLRWQAQIHHLVDGVEEIVCEGDDDFYYRAGRNTYRMSIDLWVGDEGCANRLTLGEVYTARAVWRASWMLQEWKDEETSVPFVYSAERATK